jgi:acyl-CoA thioesterase FadM
VEKMGRVQVTFMQEVRRGGEALMRASVNVACVETGSFRPVPIPEEVRAAFADVTDFKVEQTVRPL